MIYGARVRQIESLYKFSDFRIPILYEVLNNLGLWNTF